MPNEDNTNSTCVKTSIVNPNALDHENFFGRLDGEHAEQVSEWKDGVLAAIFRSVAPEGPATELAKLQKESALDQDKSDQVDTVS